MEFSDVFSFFLVGGGDKKNLIIILYVCAFFRKADGRGGVWGGWGGRGLQKAVSRYLGAFKSK